MALRYGCRSLECKFGEETRELGRLPKFPNLVIIAEDPLNYVPFVRHTGVRSVDVTGAAKDWVQTHVRWSHGGEFAGGVGWLDSSD